MKKGLFMAFIMTIMFVALSVSVSAANTTLSALQSKFPNGAYWNGGDHNSYTWNPCQYHYMTVSSTCTYCLEATQCHGFVKKLVNEYYGGDVNDWTKAYNLNYLKAGDAIRYNGHSVWVTNVSGDIVTFADCNSDWQCKIRWGEQQNKNYFMNLEHVYVAPYEILDITEAPTTPTGLLSGTWGDRVQIQWNTVSDADCYECGLIDVNTLEVVLKAEVYDWYYNFYNVPEGEYYAYVCSRNSAGDSKHADWYRINVTWYRVSYDSNYGGGAITDQIKKYNINLTLYTTEPYRTGYAFKNWNTKSDGTGTTYNPGDLYTSNSSVTLYAQWEKLKSYTKTQVIDYGMYKICNTESFNIDTSCSIIISSYKNGQMVSCEIRDSVDESETFAIFGDIDEIKVMVWDGLSTMKPLCDAEVIPSSEWTTE